MHNTQGLIFSSLKLLSISGLTVLAISLIGATRVEAATTVCTAIWSPPDGVPGGTKSAPIQGVNPPCPASPITVTVGTGSGTGAGTIFAGSWNTLLLSNQYPTTSNSAIIVGSAPLSSDDVKIEFDRPVKNPYFYASGLTYTENITFSSPFAILQSNGVSVSGSTITGSGTSDFNVGFVAQFLGNYSEITFNHTTTTSAYADGFGFTTGVTPVPGPLPILAVAAALGQSRRLRRLCLMQRDRRSQLG
jgi:hypothetical protein